LFFGGDLSRVIFGRLVSSRQTFFCVQWFFPPRCFSVEMRSRFWLDEAFSPDSRHRIGLSLIRRRVRSTFRLHSFLLSFLSNSSPPGRISHDFDQPAILSSDFFLVFFRVALRPLLGLPSFDANRVPSFILFFSSFLLPLLLAFRSCGFLFPAFCRIFVEAH